MIIIDELSRCCLANVAFAAREGSEKNQFHQNFEINVCIHTYYMFALSSSAIFFLAFIFRLHYENHSHVLVYQCSSCVIVLFACHMAHGTTHRSSANLIRLRDRVQMMVLNSNETILFLLSKSFENSDIQIKY